jgi:ABC-2 type transport system ATP-binding protein
MIAARSLSKRFGPVTAVEDLSFEIPTGAVCGFLGPNGSGKTTTLRMLAGLLRPDRGALRIDGLDALRDDLEVRRRVGYLPEGAPAYPEMRVEEYLRFRHRLADAPGPIGSAVASAIERCELGSVRRRLIGALSRGFRQRVGLAAALLASPAVLLLDEPTEGLDPVQVQHFRGLLRSFSQERTVLLSSHLLSEVEAVCDRLLLLREGRLVAEGPLAALRAAVGGDRVVVRCAFAGLPRTPDLSGVPGFLDSEPIELADPSERSVRVVARGDGAACREAIAAAVVAAGGRVRELVEERPSLEQLFLQVAGGGAR